MSFITDLFTKGATDLGKTVGDIIKQVAPNEIDRKEVDLKVQEEINKFTISVGSQAETQLEAYLGDVKDARNREIQIATSEKAPLFNKVISPALATGVTLGFFGILFYMLMKDVPKSNEQVLNIMLGSLGTAWIGIIFYYFGSSAGSAAKEQTISNLSKPK